MDVNLIKYKQRTYKRGSITIEATMLLPVFLIGMFSIVSIGKLMIFKMQMHCVLSAEATELLNSCADGHNEAISDVHGQVIGILNDYSIDYDCIVDGCEGIDLSGSRLDNTEYVEVVATYRYIPFGANILDIVYIPITQKCVMHAQCGYINGFLGEDSDTYVYVATNSEVYHCNRECSHIRLTIVPVEGSNIIHIRNNNGAKYYSCSSCHSNENDGILYVTPDGNKYHNSITCSGLRRRVRAIRITDVGDRRPCSRCGR